MYTGEQDRTLGNGRMDTHEMYTGEQDRTLGNHVGWTLIYWGTRQNTR